MAELTTKETQRRTKLSIEKPLAHAKIIKYPERLERGECNAIIDFCFDYVCNLHCKHCLNTQIIEKDRKITIDDIHHLAVQADELGMAQFCISGGEPLIFKELDSIFKAIMPEKFHIAMSTNGMFLDEKMAKHLKSIGLDKIKISVDSIDEAKASAQRNNGKQYQQALQALKNAKNAGIDAVIQHVVTHQTVRENDFIKLLEYATENGYMVDTLPARALGAWKGRHEILLTKKDGDYLRELHKKYPVLRWDMLPANGLDKKSCGAVKQVLHVTKYGDVLPCVYIQIAIGNIMDESLKDIIDRGFNIKWFREFQSLCLSGQDKNFIKNYMEKGAKKGVPTNYKDIFTAEDFIDPSKEDFL